MIVIGADWIESYLANHAGHKGIKAVRTQFQAWLDIVGRAQWRNPENVKASYPKASILKSNRVVFNIKGNDYRLVARIQYQAGVVAVRSSEPMPNTIKSMRRQCNGCNSDCDR